MKTLKRLALRWLWSSVPCPGWLAPRLMWWATGADMMKRVRGF